MIEVGIIMGSDSDLPVMKESAEILEKFGIRYEITIVSAHRTPEKLYDYAKTAAERGLKVIISGAGGAAHLPGMVAAISPLPVIGVPIKTSALNGLDSLYSIVQMPGGVPVATVAINGGLNAGILAAQIIGSSDISVRNKITEYKKNLEAAVLKKGARLESAGYAAHMSYDEESLIK